MFTIQTLLYKFLMFITGLMIKIIPQPKPTVYAGPDSSLQLCKNISQLGHSRVLIVRQVRYFQHKDTALIWSKRYGRTHQESAIKSQYFTKEHFDL